MPLFFQALGVKGTMVDKYPQPISLLVSDFTNTFVNAFKNLDGNWVENTPVTDIV